MTNGTVAHHTRIRLDAIVFDAGTQVRQVVNEHVVADYAEAMTAGAPFPPVLLFHDGTRYYLADGFHRCLAAQRNTVRDIEAEVRPGTAKDALWAALGANGTHGLRLTVADKAHAIRRALAEWPDRSEREIAEQIGCSKTYVHNLKPQVVTSDHVRVTGKDGKSYPASRAEARAHAAPVNGGEPVVAPAPFQRRLAPPRNGLQFARIAIMKLEEIRDDDAERQQAFTAVRRWLDARRTGLERDTEHQQDVDRGACCGLDDGSQPRCRICKWAPNYFRRDEPPDAHGATSRVGAP